MGASTEASAPDPGQQARPGRPRDAGLDVAILGAALTVLGEVGYDRLSIEFVAARAGVGKTSVYRRYPDKPALVAAAVDTRGPTSAPPDTSAERLREALLATMRWLAHQIADQEIGLLGAVFAGMRGDPRFAEAMRTILRRDTTSLTEHLLEPSSRSNEPVVPHAADLVAEIAPALLVHRVLLTANPGDEAFLEHLVDDVLLPLIRQHTTSAPPSSPSSPSPDPDDPLES